MPYGPLSIRAAEWTTKLQSENGSTCFAAVQVSYTILNAYNYSASNSFQDFAAFGTWDVARPTVALSLFYAMLQPKAMPKPMPTQCLHRVLLNPLSNEVAGSVWHPLTCPPFLYQS
jgi:hypothetical protein